MNSTRDDFKILPTSFSTSISKSNRITRANTLLFKSFNSDQNKQNLNKFISNSRIEFSSKTTNHFHQQHHPHIKWVTYHQSFQRSLTDFKLISMVDIPSNSSIKDFDNEHQDQTVKYISNPILTSEDEDDRELLPNRKTFVDQASQAVLEDPKPKKKIKSNSKRANVVQIPPSTLSLSSPNRVTSNGDLITLTSPMKVSSSIGKNEENNGTKSLITVDTSKARSNLEVVRLCLRELAWKEVEILIKLFQFFFLLYISSVHIIQMLIQIFIGIHHHFMKVIQILPLIPVELINFLVCLKNFF
jgi:hypothetical protein